jgi:hypothetical protein
LGGRKRREQQSERERRNQTRRCQIQRPVLVHISERRKENAHSAASRVLVESSGGKIHSEHNTDNNEWRRLSAARLGHRRGNF